jgi:hypothetical protein
MLCGRHAPRRHSDLKPLSRQRARASRQRCLAFAAPLPTAPPAPDSAAPPDRCLTHAVVVPTARAPTAVVRSRVARTAAGRLAVPAVARRRLRAGEPPPPLSPVRRCRATAGSPGSAAAEPCATGQSCRPRCTSRGRPSERRPRPCAWAVHPRGRGPRTRYARGPSALCIWAERGFGPVAPS